MKILLVIVSLFILSNCTNNSSATTNESLPAKPSPTPTSSPVQDEASKVDEARRKELEAQNERFKIAPEHFNNIDFKNFSYPYPYKFTNKKGIPLTEGRFEYDFRPGSARFHFKDVFYVDLTGDGKQEAIVLLWYVSCGASCDGGAGLFYIYTIQQNKLKLIWQFETGSLAYGCGLKSFAVKDRKITMELFGRCFDEREKSISTKYWVKDTTLIIFGFNGKKFIEEKKEFIDVPEREVRNYHAEISINE